MRPATQGKRDEPPILLVKWHDLTRWMLDRVDSFPKNQRFVFGQRLADRVLNILELLVEAAYSSRKADLLVRANRDIEVLRKVFRGRHQSCSALRLPVREGKYSGDVINPVRHSNCIRVGD